MSATISAFVHDNLFFSANALLTRFFSRTTIERRCSEQIVA
jgi:hypothetical protein